MNQFQSQRLPARILDEINVPHVAQSVIRLQQREADVPLASFLAKGHSSSRMVANCDNAAPTDLRQVSYCRISCYSSMKLAGIFIGSRCWASFTEFMLMNSGLNSLGDFNGCR